MSTIISIHDSFLEGAETDYQARVDDNNILIRKNS
jgi:hypothetical protein